ncbi:hypothetical protein [Halalkalibacillus halophilus]|uniref:hypothetical protein n=1 Tax=Halalkalibacillus halophilus TaxID=392827 RepID=UPI0004151ADB|nr:hypothetical protein [Halalkalibacillus halophilus]
MYGYYNNAQLENRVEEKIQQEVKSDNYEMVIISDTDQSVLVSVIYDEEVEGEDEEVVIGFWTKYNKQNGELIHDYTTEFTEEDEQ